MITQEYLDYLRSDVWQRKRSERLKIDNYRCQICHRPFSLDVHHLNYPETLGEEDVYRDLITLCRSCHEDIERKKREFDYAAERQRQHEARQAEWQRQYELEMARIYRAIKRNMDNDLSRGGQKDYCNQDVIRADFGEECEGISYISAVQAYFRNRRYEVILDMMARGYSPRQVIDRTGFSYNMVHKVFDRPLNAKTLIEKEIKFND